MHLQIYPGLSHTKLAIVSGPLYTCRETVQTPLIIFYHSSIVRLNASIINPAKSLLFSREARYFYNRTDKGGPMKLQQAAVHA